MNSAAEKQFYVYIFRDPDGIPIYVGKGLYGRWKGHFPPSCDSRLGRKLRKLKSQGILLEPEIFEALDEDHAFFLEIYLIDFFGREDKSVGSLYNRTDGGEGSCGVYWSEERKKAFSEFKKVNNSFKGTKHSPEKIELFRKLSTGRIKSEKTRHLLSVALTGRIHSDETKQKLSIAAKGHKNCVGRVLSQETRDKIRKSKTGQTLSDETKKKISDTKKKVFLEKQQNFLLLNPNRSIDLDRPCLQSS